MTGYSNVEKVKKKKAKKKVDIKRVKGGWELPEPKMPKPKKITTE